MCTQNRNVLLVVGVFLLSLYVVVCEDSVCSDRFSRFHGSKQPGSRGFSITIKGNPAHYQPGKIYTVRLNGWSSRYLVDRFTAFTIRVSDNENEDRSIQAAGMFLPFGNGVSKVDDACPGYITQASTSPKAEVKVLWKAPPPVRSPKCVRFRAMVVMSTYSWFMDDEGLTKLICQSPSQHRIGINSSPSSTIPSAATGSVAARGSNVNEATGTYQPPLATRTETSCCPCANVQYKMRFDGVWSRETHPKHFPRVPHVNHFSDVLVVSHSADLKFWNLGTTASPGVQRVAEFGDISALSNQFRHQSDKVKMVSRAAGLWYPHVQGSTSTVVTMDRAKPYLSLISMLGPSPDWIVGVSALSMCSNSCQWIESHTMNLPLIDAGTDSGLLYESINSPTLPLEPMRLINNTWPEGSPFYDPEGPGIAPFARVTLTKIKSAAVACSDYGSDVHPREEYEAPRTESQVCSTSTWSSWSNCSARCGPGVRMRTRHYSNPLKAAMFNCSQQLLQKTFCDRVCPVSGEEVELSEDVCATSEWSPWSDCSATCGSGIRMRRRTYLNRMGRTLCNLDNFQKKTCYGDRPTCIDSQKIETECHLSSWSGWSPCSAACGTAVGHQTRSRLRLRSSNELTTNCSRVPLTQTRNCRSDQTNCQLRGSQAKLACSLPPDTGDCRGVFTRYFYDTTKRMCLPFEYSGCRGNLNNFRDVNTCQSTCAGVL